ncbi:MAG TPA: hypothetical protein DCE27_04820 [Xanthomarina gelatinilytica]|nr:hypothetical protein [Xanthomarina gelatinilytica]|tara:strand:+ start:383 stop:592 length:210 start_codon:yes stop_codon:yes gene_type:complete
MRIKGKWLPGNNKSELRKEDHSDIIKTLNTLSKKKIICRSEGCEKEAAAIIDRFTFCADCGLAYLKAKG